MRSGCGIALCSGPSKVAGPGMLGSRSLSGKSGCRSLPNSASTTKIRSVFSRLSSTYCGSLLALAVVWPLAFTASGALPLLTLTTLLPPRFWMVASPESTWVSACSRSARRLSSKGFGISWPDTSSGWSWVMADF